MQHWFREEEQNEKHGKCEFYRGLLGGKDTGYWRIELDFRAGMSMHIFCVWNLRILVV